MPKDLKVEIATRKCSECRDNVANFYFLENFKWGVAASPLIAYDKETESIVFNENTLMTMVQVANPIQKPRPIRVVSQDEFKAIQRRRFRPADNTNEVKE